MAKEWILNMATSRWGLNKKEKVGPVSQWIRECNPKKLDEWEKFYYKKLADFLKRKGIPLSPEEYIEIWGGSYTLKSQKLSRKKLRMCQRRTVSNTSKTL